MKFYTLLQTVFLVGILTTLAEGTNDASCSLDQLNIIPGDGVATITPIATIPIATDDGSLKTTVSCDVSGIADAITYMNVRCFWYSFFEQHFVLVPKWYRWSYGSCEPHFCRSFLL